MTWQWVVLVVGVVALVVLLLGYITWVNMKIKIFEIISKTNTIPISDLEINHPVREDTIIHPADADTMIKPATPEWPQAFTGSEEEDK